MEWITATESMQTGLETVESLNTPVDEDGDPLELYLS